MHRRTLEIASRRWGSVTWSIVMGLGLLQTRFAHGCLRDTTLQKWKADCAGLAECSRPGRDYLQLRGVDVEQKTHGALREHAGRVLQRTCGSTERPQIIAPKFGARLPPTTL